LRIMDLRWSLPLRYGNWSLEALHLLKLFTSWIFVSFIVFAFGKAMKATQHKQNMQRKSKKYAKEKGKQQRNTTGPTTACAESLRKWTLRAVGTNLFRPLAELLLQPSEWTFRGQSASSQVSSRHLLPLP
jgi:hypothetical protein